MDNYSNEQNYYAAHYWLFKQFGGARGEQKWKTFHHNGVIFPPEYVPHGIPIIYDGNPIKLEPKQEEMATIYAKYTDTEYMNNRVFKKNFWNDWKKILGKSSKIQSLEKCNFNDIYNYVIEQKEIKKNIPKEEKQREKELREKMEEKYKIAYIDGKPQPVGNFRVEPPGIFIGRGCHPKLGKIKRRIYAEDITLNLSKDANIPNPPKGHEWATIINDNTVEWLASWKDDITGKIKYVWLAAHSDMKAEGDKKKFDRARELKKKIKKIRETNNINLQSNDVKLKQTATALYFIDNLALRVGNEKGEDEADTVGVTSLRIEHIKLNQNNNITLDFLGKDSINYVKTFDVPNVIYSNISSFMEGKKKEDALFDMINSNDINKYLQSYMKDLTAKVFRTYNASDLFQIELDKISKKYDGYTLDDKFNILLDEFNKANFQVALLCNHQKNVSKNFDSQIDKIDDNIKDLKKKIKEIKNKDSKDDKDKQSLRIKKIKDNIKKLEAKKEIKIQMKNISLGTSKINYIDPRITVAFMKKHNLPVDKIFSKTLQERFKWSFEVDENYKF